MRLIWARGYDTPRLIGAPPSPPPHPLDLPSRLDIVTTFIRVAKSYNMPEYLELLFNRPLQPPCSLCPTGKGACTCVCVTKDCKCAEAAYTEQANKALHPAKSLVVLGLRRAPGRVGSVLISDSGSARCTWWRDWCLFCELTGRAGAVLGQQEIGFCHMRVVDGNTSLLQLCGLLAKLCKVATTAKP
eukprot:1185649-Prorocentrum_minimum.AAC.5